jgi:hypothetical protein
MGERFSGSRFSFRSALPSGRASIQCSPGVGTIRSIFDAHLTARTARTFNKYQKLFEVQYSTIPAGKA